MNTFRKLLLVGVTAAILPGCAVADDDDRRWRPGPVLGAELMRGDRWDDRAIHRGWRGDDRFWTRHRGRDDDDRQGRRRWRNRDDGDDEGDDGDDDGDD